MQHKNLKSYFVIKDTKNTERYKQGHSYSTVHRRQQYFATETAIYICEEAWLWLSNKSTWEV